MDYSLRTYRDSDWEAVIALWIDSGIPMGHSECHAVLERARRLWPELFLVAEDPAGRIVGAVWGSFDGRRAALNHLAVEKGCRGRGLGKRLVRELLERLRATDAVKIHLQVFSDNAELLDFYRAFGFYRRDDLIMMSADLRGNRFNHTRGPR